MVENVQERTDKPTTLEGRTLYIPQMAYAGARMMAAAFRSIGIDATVSPDSDTETLELGGLHASGEECLPHKVTLGDFLKVCRAPGFDPDKTAFFMPTAHGPCRFGQYTPYLRMVLDELGHGDVPIVSPSSDNGYDGLGDQADDLMRTGWMGMVTGDVATKFLLKTRPYETTPGDADQAFEESVKNLGDILSIQGITSKQKMTKLVAGIEKMGERFRAIPAKYTKDRPLIGLVGEIFCRLNTFSNDDLARRIEQHGGECWISDIAEWVWYTNWSQETELIDKRGRLNMEYAKFKIKAEFQHHFERTIQAPVTKDLVGYEEPHDIREVLEMARPYLPAEGCLGEMVLSTGKAIYLHNKGADGIVDISPFTCMNGIICEAVYPALSDDHDRIPIQNFYFDGVNTNVDRDLEIFLDLARAYQRRKTKQRTYPAYFE